MTSSSAWMPDRMAFMREAALPAAVRGPVDFCALRRLAAIWAVVAIVFRSLGPSRPGLEIARERAGFRRRGLEVPERKVKILLRLLSTAGRVRAGHFRRMPVTPWELPTCSFRLDLLSTHETRSDLRPSAPAEESGVGRRGDSVTRTWHRTEPDGLRRVRIAVSARSDRGGSRAHLSLMGGRQQSSIVSQFSRPSRQPRRADDRGVQPDAVLAGARRRPRKDLRAGGRGRLLRDAGGAAGAGARLYRGGKASGAGCARCPGVVSVLETAVRRKARGARAGSLVERAAIPDCGRAAGRVSFAPRLRKRAAVLRSVFRRDRCGVARSKQPQPRTGNSNHSRPKPRGGGRRAAG